MHEQVKIILPIPHRILSPNARPKHFMQKAGATKKARKLGKETMEEAQLGETWPACRTQEAFFFATNRNRDERNAVAMLKAYYDGFVDAGLIPDDSYHFLKHDEPTFSIDKENPRVEITLTKVEPTTK